MILEFMWAVPLTGWCEVLWLSGLAACIKAANGDVKNHLTDYKFTRGYSADGERAVQVAEPLTAGQHHVQP